MALEKLNGLLYRITICFNADPAYAPTDPKTGEPGKPLPLGALRTYMLETGSCIIDTETNTLASPYQPAPAVDLDKDGAVALLGEKFGDLLGQLSAERAATADLAAALAQAKQDAAANLAAELGKMEEKIAALNATRRDDLAVHEKAMAAAGAQNAALSDHLAARERDLATATAQIATLTESLTAATATIATQSGELSAAKEETIALNRRLDAAKSAVAAA